MDYVIKSDNSIWRKGTLAHALDKRSVSFGEPTSENLPEKINPLLLLKEVVGNNLTIISIKQSDITNDLTGVLKVLQCTAPVGNAFIIIKELPVETISYKFNGVDTCRISTALRITDTFVNGIEEDE